MAENVTSKIARMLSEVEAVHRWCVTGTPAEKGLSGEFKTSSKGLHHSIKFLALVWNFITLLLL